MNDHIMMPFVGICDKADLYCVPCACAQFGGAALDSMIQVCWPDSQLTCDTCKLSLGVAAVRETSRMITLDNNARDWAKSALFEMTMNCAFGNEYPRAALLAIDHVAAGTDYRATIGA